MPEGFACPDCKGKFPWGCDDSGSERAASVASPEGIGGGSVPVVGGGYNRERATKLRHGLWQSASQFIRIPKLDWRFAWGSLGFVMSNAGSYRHHVRDKAILLMNEETHRLSVLPYFTRFSEGYYRKAIRKLKGVRADRGVFLTLTIDPSRFTSLHQAYRELQRGWNKLLTMLRKRYGHLDFIKIPEFTKAGVPHLHALFFGIPRLIDADELREFWLKRYGEGTFVHIKKLYNGSNRVISYLVKYMSKLLDAPDHEFKGTDGLIDAQA